MKKKIVIAAITAILVLSVSGFAFAGHGKGFGRGNCDDFRSACRHLSPEKQKAADAVINKYSSEMTQLRNKLETKHSVLQAMINRGDSNEEKIGKLVTEISELRDRLWDVRKKMSAELEEATGLSLRGKGMGCPRFGGHDSYHGGFHKNSRSGKCPRSVPGDAS